MNRRAFSAVPLAVLALAGCAVSRWQTPPPIRAVAHAPADTFADVTPAYRIACPDVLEVRFTEMPEWDCLSSVGVDGDVSVGRGWKVRVAGLPASDAARAIADALRLDPAAVTVSVADPRAGTVDLYGPEQKRHRTVAYRGPETIRAFLQRTGALKPGHFDPRDVSILRPNVAAGRDAEVFHVDLDAIVLDGDPRTDIAVEPGDQVYVGESRRSSFARLLPQRLKPMYRRLLGLEPTRPPTPTAP